MSFYYIIFFCPQSKASLQAKLEARRRRKGDISKARLEKDALLAAEAEKRDDVLEKLKEDAVTKSRAKTAAPAPTGAKVGGALDGINSLRPEDNGRNFSDASFKYISSRKIVEFDFTISPVPMN